MSDCVTCSGDRHQNCPAPTTDGYCCCGIIRVEAPHLLGPGDILDVNDPGQPYRIKLYSTQITESTHINANFSWLTINYWFKRVDAKGHEIPDEILVVMDGDTFLRMWQQGLVRRS